MRVNWAIASAAFAAFILVAAGVRAGDGASALQTAAAKAEQEKSASPNAQPEGKLSDRVVRIMLGFAWGMVPEDYAGEDGKTIKVDKSDPKKFIIPVDDARKVIRAASRSAYAQICGMPDRQQANYVAFMRGEKKRSVWTTDQLTFINALHLFTVLYLTGNANLVEKDDAPPALASKAPAIPATPLAPSQAPAAATTKAPELSKVQPPLPGMTPVPKSAVPGISIGIPEAVPPSQEWQDRAAAATEPSKVPTCSQEQKERVQQAIDTFVKDGKS